jgi:hypothetical protein
MGSNPHSCMAHHKRRGVYDPQRSLQHCHSHLQRPYRQTSDRPQSGMPYAICHKIKKLTYKPEWTLHHTCIFTHNNKICTALIMLAMSSLLAESFFSCTAIQLKQQLSWCGLGATAHNPPDPHWFFLLCVTPHGGLPDAGTYVIPSLNFLLAVSSKPANSFLSFPKVYASGGRHLSRSSGLACNQSSEVKN